MTPAQGRAPTPEMLQFLCRGAGALATRGLLTQSSGRGAWEAGTQSEPSNFTLQATQLKTVESFKKLHYFRNLEIGVIRLHPDRVIGLEASNVHRRFARLMIFQDSSPKRIVHSMTHRFCRVAKGWPSDHARGKFCPGKLFGCKQVGLFLLELHSQHDTAAYC